MEITKVTVQRIDEADGHSDEANRRRDANCQALAYRVQGVHCVGVLNLRGCKSQSWAEELQEFIHAYPGEEVTSVELYENGAMNLIISDNVGQVAYVRVRP